jgi:hypothetical protein
MPDEYVPKGKGNRIIEKGRKKAYRAGKQFEVELDKINDEAVLKIKAAINKANYKNTKAVKDTVNKSFKKLNKDIDAPVKALESSVKATAISTIQESNNFYDVVLSDKKVAGFLKGAKGQKLSPILHSTNRDTRNRFLKVLRKGMKEGQGAVELAKNLANLEDITRQGLKIPGYIQDIENALRRAASADPATRAASVKELRGVLRKHRRYIDDLTRAGADGFQDLGVRAAGRQFADKAAAFATDIESVNQSNIDKILNDWKDSKIKYHQTVASRTEISNIYNDYMLEYADNADHVIGFSSVLSDSHPEVDICDELAGDYLFDEWAIGDIPKPTHHPQCLCRGELIIDPAFL